MLPAPKLFSEEFRIRGKKKFFRFRRNSARFHQIPARFLRNHYSLFVGITVEGILEKKKSKVPELKEIETWGGLIEKIETLVAELKIAANFRGG
jgi:hypothetical protein